MMTFYIDPVYLTSVPNRTEHKLAKNFHESEADFIIRKLKTDTDMNCTMYFTEHPVFDKLKEELNKLGFISVSPHCRNGDKVLVPFQLNNKIFNKYDTFYCASAMNAYLK